MIHAVKILWLFGQPSSGKTALATLLRERLQKAGRFAVMLDEDELREATHRGLSATGDDGAEGLRGAAELAKILAAQGNTVICAFATPRESQRALIREILGDSASLVHLDCPSEVAMPCDVDGHGEGPSFEPPSGDFLSVPVHDLPLNKAADLIWDKFLRSQIQFASLMDDGPMPHSLPAYRALRRLVLLGSAVSLALVSILFYAWYGSHKSRDFMPESEETHGTGKSTGGVSMSKFNSVTSGPSLNTYTPPDAASALEAAQRLVIEYWKAGTWQEKLKLVSKPERVAALMRTFYEKQEGHDLQGRVLRAHAFRRNGSTEILTLTYEAETSATDPAVTLNLVRQSDGSWLLDWDLSASGRSTVSR